MNFNSRKTSFVILGFTSLICSRAMFAFIHDTEGPNLLVVIVMAGVIFALSHLISVFGIFHAGIKKLLFIISMQILITGAFFLLLR